MDSRDLCDCLLFPAWCCLFALMILVEWVTGKTFAINRRF